MLEDYGKIISNTIKMCKLKLVNGQLGRTNFSLRTINVCSKTTLQTCQTGQHTSETTCLSSRLVVQQVAKVMGLVTLFWELVFGGQCHMEPRKKKQQCRPQVSQWWIQMSRQHVLQCCTVLSPPEQRSPLFTSVNFVSYLMFCRWRAARKLAFRGWKAQQNFTLHDYFRSLQQC